VTIIRNALLDGADRPLRNHTVKITLVAPGNPFTDDGQAEVIQTHTVATDRAGNWSADLRPNVALEASGTYYQVDERDGLPGGQVWTIVVPPTGGPYWLRDVLVTPPAPGQPFPPVPPHSLDQHTDVDTAGAVAGRALVYDGNDWVPGLAAPSAHTHAVADVTGLGAQLSGLTGGLNTLTGRVDGLDADVADLDLRVGVLEAIPPGSGGGGILLPKFNVEDPTYAGGAVGDGVTDDYPAIRAAWDAMLASPVGGVLFFPRVAVYRIAATSLRLGPSPDQAYALFPIPMIPSDDGPLKRVYGVVGAGIAAVVRTAASFGEESNPAQVLTSSTLFVDYAGSFSWSLSNGLPSVFGAPDADITGHATDNIISNLHWYASGLTVRQPDNPSLCGMNLELVSTCTVPDISFDVVSVLDDVVEPTRPTGIAMLAPKSNNNVAVHVGNFVAVGMYAGAPFTEHMHLESAEVLRCKIGFHNRRPCTHMGDAYRLKLEQCLYGFAGIDPAAPGAHPNRGVVPWYGGTLNNVSCNFEDFGYLNLHPWQYTPANGAHFYAPRGGLSGRVYEFRVNSETPSPIGVPPFGGSGSCYVYGPSGGGLTFSDFAIFTASAGAAERFLGRHPTPPRAPAVGVITTAGPQAVSVPFTASTAGAPADDYTVSVRRVSDDVEVGTSTGTTSPRTVTGLPNVPVYAVVVATNAEGDSPESGESNQVTPDPPLSLPSDTFDGTGALTTSTSGHTYEGNAGDEWSRNAGSAVHGSGGTAFNNAAWLPAGVDDVAIALDMIATDGLEAGVVGRVTDVSNLLMLDVTFHSAGTAANVELYRRVAGTFTAFGNGGGGAVTVTGLTAGQPVALVLECEGTTIRARVNGSVVTTGTDATQAGQGAGFTWGANAAASLDNLVLTAL
jgi:hypothetical protein